MGTEVLRAQDPLQRMRVIGHGAPVLSPVRRNNSRSNYQNPNPRKQHHPHEQPPQFQRRESMVSKKSDDCVVLKKNTNSNLVIGGFTLLKRGESIDESTKKKIDGCLVVESKVESKKKVVIVEPVAAVDKKLKKKKIQNNQNKKNNDLVVFGGTKRLGPDPEMVPKQVKFSDLLSSSPPPPVSSKSPPPPVSSKNGVLSRSCPKYAGSGFVQSPEPDSLPLPSFSLPSSSFMMKKRESLVVVDDTVSVSATKNLRRMLGLDGNLKAQLSI